MPITTGNAPQSLSGKRISPQPNAKNPWPSQNPLKWGKKAPKKGKKTPGTLGTLKRT